MEKPKLCPYTPDPVRGTMTDVLIALCPALILGALTFGPRALTVTAVSVAACLAFEWLWMLGTRRMVTVPDLSAAVTGMLLAFLMPVSVPLWLPVIGAAVAIIGAKQLYGGLGRGLFDPALAGAAFLQTVFRGFMSRFTAPRTAMPLFATPAVEPLADLSASPLARLLGQHAGNLGETATLAILAGGAYLIWRRSLRWRIPAACLGVAAAAAVIFSRGDVVGSLADSLCGGALMLAAVFIAADPATAPEAPALQWAYGAGCGLLTVLLRAIGGAPEVVVFAILLMNALKEALEKLLERVMRRWTREAPVAAPQETVEAAAPAVEAEPEPVAEETPEVPEEAEALPEEPGIGEPEPAKELPAPDPEAEELSGGSLAELARKLGLSENEEPEKTAEAAAPAPLQEDDGEAAIEGEIAGIDLDTLLREEIPELLREEAPAEAVSEAPAADTMEDAPEDAGQEEAKS